MKPMLAGKAPETLAFPLYASFKLDGIRAVTNASQVLSRTLKHIPNQYVQRMLGFPELHGLDGELTVGEPNHPNVMQSTTSGVMSQDGEPDFTFWVFDFWTDPAAPFAQRWDIMQTAFKNGALGQHPRIRLLQQTLIRDQQELNAFERMALELGYEGIMTRSLSGIYKHGRSTAREGYLLKVKRFTDGEAVVIGVEELMHNGNEAQTDALGHTKRSSHQENKVPMGTLGALVVKDVVTGVEFNIGTGFNSVQRDKLWGSFVNGNLTGVIVKYKHFEVGAKDAPRFPVFQGFRDPIDIGEL